MDTMVKPPEVDPPEPEEDQDDLDEAMPRVQVTRKHVLLFALLGISTVAFLYFVLPQLADLEEQGKDIGEGDPWWLAGAFALHGAVLRRLRRDVPRRLHRRRHRASTSRASYQITMAGLAATRLFAAGGAGGIALTAWALRRAGHGPPQGRRQDARLPDPDLRRLHAALVVVGFGLYFGVLDGPGAVRDHGHPGDLRARRDRARARARARAAGPAAPPGGLRAPRRAARAAGAAAGQRARGVLRGHARGASATCASAIRSLLGAIAYWGFNIATLWACFHAFGDPPPWRVIVMAYFVGFLGNLLPLPGGIGGVDGGMIGAFARVRRRRRPRRSRPCCPTACSRSGCRRSRARSRTSSCAARSRAGARSAARAASSRRRRARKPAVAGSGVLHYPL